MSLSDTYLLSAWAVPAGGKRSIISKKRSIRLGFLILETVMAIPPKTALGPEVTKRVKQGFES
jgi:hypothetical protein